MGYLRLSSCFTALLLAFTVQSVSVDAQPRDEKPKLSAHEMPALSTDEMKLRYLFYIQEHIPNVFKDATTYDINLFQLLDDQARLSAELSQHAAHAAGWSARQDYLEATITMKSSEVVKETRIDPKAVQNWKNNLQNALHELKPNQSLVEARKATLVQLQKTSSSGLMSGLVTALPRDKIGLLKGKTFDEQLSIFKQYLPEQLPSTFKGDLYQLPKHVTAQDAIQQLKGFSVREKELKTLLAKQLNLELLAHKKLQIAPETITQSKNLNQAISAIGELTEADLIWSTDLNDVITPGLKELQVKGKDLDKNLSNYSQSFTDQVVSEQKSVKAAVTLKEVPPGFGIFRGCISGDCQSQYSFPFPNDPNEHVFFIFDQDNKAKGVLTGTVVNVEGKPHFYAITASGAKLSKAETNLVLSGLDQLKIQLKVHGVILPEEDRLSSLLNHTGTRAAYTELVAKAEPVKIDYLNPEIRKKIEKFKSEYNSQTSQYDHMSKNRIGVKVDPKKLFPSESITLNVTKTHWSPSFKPLSQIELFQFAIDLQTTHRTKELEKVLAVMQLNVNDFGEVTRVLLNDNLSPLKTYISDSKAVILKTLKIENIPEEKLFKLTSQGATRASDLFSEKNFKLSEKLFLKFFEDKMPGTITNQYKSFYGPLFENWSKLPDQSPLKKIANDFIKERGWGKSNLDEAKNLTSYFDLDASEKKNTFTHLELILENETDPSHALLKKALNKPQMEPILKEFIKDGEKYSAFMKKIASPEHLLHSWLPYFAKTHPNEITAGFLNLDINTPKWSFDTSENIRSTIVEFASNIQVNDCYSANTALAKSILSDPSNPGYPELIQNLLHSKERSSLFRATDLDDVFQKNHFLFQHLGEKYFEKPIHQINESTSISNELDQYKSRQIIEREKKLAKKRFPPLYDSNAPKLLTTGSPCAASTATFLKAAFKP